jgi:hypothetical protein
MENSFRASHYTLRWLLRLAGDSGNIVLIGRQHGGEQRAGALAAAAARAKIVSPDNPVASGAWLARW